ncbi:MAG: hypothetical protein KAJ07_00405 [Planctomycetes bacterium]|nr:hypothetical protein [Planctomycetota bacterium]
MDLNNVSTRTREILARRTKWDKVKVELIEPLTPHEIGLGRVFSAESQDEQEAAYQALRDRIKADGGWHGGRRLAEDATRRLEVGNIFTMDCGRCGKTHRGIIEEGPVIARVRCDRPALDV